jgi:6-phosphogluconate dehydrogenase
MNTRPNGFTIGLIGLGVMGRNLALNLASKGVMVVAYDAWPEARSRAQSVDFAPVGSSITLVHDLRSLVESLPRPRAILLMIKAGAPVDVQISVLLPLLSPGDVIIDGGNSHYRDTARREMELAKREIGYIGLGVSGGAQGARYGPSMMAGGNEQAFERLHPLLETIAAQTAEGPCLGWFGGGGAGHLVKTLHNGIEYAVMQAISEIYLIMRDGLGFDAERIAEAFARWNQGELESYLVDITGRVLARREGDGVPLVDRIEDSAGQKGTGRWSAEISLSLGVAAPVIIEAVMARGVAAAKTQRMALSKTPLRDQRQKASVIACEHMIEHLAQALFATMLVSFAQGFTVIAAASDKEGWDIDLAQVARVWQGGCIIRAACLKDIAEFFDCGNSEVNLLGNRAFQARLVAPGWRRTIALAVELGLPVPVLSSALAFVDGFSTARSGANLIQGQRDYFGAHGFTRTDREGMHRHNWQLDAAVKVTGTAVP